MVKQYSIKKKLKKTDNNKPESLNKDNDIMEFRREGVLVKDFKAWTNMVVEHRALNIDNTMIQLGFDDGQGILKLMQTIKSLDIPTYECGYGKRKYSEGYVGKNSPLSSVKKL